LKRFRTFVATNITISKDGETYPYYIDSDGLVKDIMGFTVTMTLIEVTANYADRYPGFGDYYKNILSRL
jgi:hypothetical protein